MSTPIAVFASGRGSNFQALLRAIQMKLLDAEIRVLLVDRECAAIQIAQDAGIPVEKVSFPEWGKSSEFGDRGVEAQTKFDEAILRALSPHYPKFIVLAGFKRRLGPTLLHAFKSDRSYYRVVNIHPSLLPAFPGLDSYEKAFQFGCKVTGATVHLIDEGLDTGPICAQQAIEIGDCLSVEDVEKRGLAVEHKLYPETLGWVLTEHFDLEKRRVSLASGALPEVWRWCVFPR